MKEDYPIFIKWLSATDWILDLLEKYPKSVRFTLTTRIANLTLDVMEGIIAAIYTKKRSYILARVNLYIEKLRILFRISFTRKYISQKQYEYVAVLLDDVGRMTGGWMKESS